MKKEIKFRGRILLGSVWVHGFLVDHSVIKDEKERKTFAVETYSIGQFVGILDKNGKEIYEQDVLKMRNTDDDSEWYTIVEEGGCIDQSSNGDSDWTLLKWLDGNIEFEVVGTIYDNLEFLIL